MQWAVLLILAAATPEAEAVRLTFHVAADGETGVATDAWIDGATRIASERFSAAGIRFEVDGIKRLENVGPDVASVKERNRLARRVERNGSVHVFVVRKLRDKKRKDTWIGGVHWYHGGHRYVIVSRSSGRQSTLAHELGHYFRLKHTKDPSNLMTTPDRKRDAGFEPHQVRRIKLKLRRYRATGLIRRS